MTTPPIHSPRVFKTLQNVNAPDFNLDAGQALEAETVLGMETSTLSSGKQFRIDIYTIIISALVFLWILAWFDFLQTTIFDWLSPSNDDNLIPPSTKFWYAIIVTFLVFTIIYLIYYNKWSKEI